MPAPPFAREADLSRLRGVVAELEEDRRRTGTLIRQLQGTGGGGGTGGDLNYVHTQIPLAAVWTVTHNLGKYPAVTVVDSGGSEILPNVHYDDLNTLTVTFAAATSGKVYVN